MGPKGRDSALSGPVLALTCRGSIEPLCLDSNEAEIQVGACLRISSSAGIYARTVFAMSPQTNANVMI